MTNRTPFRTPFAVLLLILFTLFSVNLMSQHSYRLNDSFNYLFPFPGATEINPHTNIIIKSRVGFNQQLIPNQLKVESSKEGILSGQILYKEDNHTLIFIPEKPFDLGDVIVVELSGIDHTDNSFTDPLVYQFEIKSQEAEVKLLDDVWTGLPEKTHTKGVINLTDIQLPEGYPFYEMGFQSDPTPNQYFFQASQVGQFFQLITDNNGVPYFYRETPSRCLDFKVNKNGYITYFDASISAYIEIDSTYRYRKTYQASFGHDTDNHDLLVMPNGHSWTIGRDYITTDMSQYIECGNPHATVLHFVIEEKDPLGVVIWQWRTFDHFNVMDGDPNQVDFCNAVVNFAHINSVELDPDGNVIISSRKLNEITKIDKATGEIIWHLGGVNNQFSIVDDPLNGFTDQHMAREDEAGIVTVFDNGNYHQSPHSRGVRYAIDTINMTATYLTGYDDNSPTVVTNPMGSMQTLSNGNVVVGWTQNPQGACLTEYNPDGEKVLEMHQTTNTTLRSYRSFKYPWKTTYFYPEEDTIDFGYEVTVGSTIVKTATIVNPNNEALEVTGSYFSNGSFGMQTQLPFTIPAQSSTEVNLSFNPFFDGDFSGYTYLMTQNDSTGISLKITLKGSTLQSGMTEAGIAEMVVSPNPFHDHLRIQSSENKEIRVVIYQGSGLIMHETELAPLQTRNLQTSSWEPGVYLMEFYSDDRIWRRKMIKF